MQSGAKLIVFSAIFTAGCPLCSVRGGIGEKSPKLLVCSTKRHVLIYTRNILGRGSSVLPIFPYIPFLGILFVAINVYSG